MEGYINRKNLEKNDRGGQKLDRATIVESPFGTFRSVVDKSPSHPTTG